MGNVFAVPVFFIVFRETLESSIIISVLLSFLRKTLGPPSPGSPASTPYSEEAYYKLRRQVWLGTSAGLLICLMIGGGLIGAFYGIGKNYWKGSEDLWEGSFNILASAIITVMGAAILRLSKLGRTWTHKLHRSLTLSHKEMPDDSRATNLFTHLFRKYFLFFLPFITVLREGLEAVIFIGGVSLSAPAKAFPLPVICAVAAGSFVGWLLYRGGNRVHLQGFLVAASVLMYLVAAGLFSKGVWSFEMAMFAKAVGGDVAETGAGPGSYDIRRSVWHVNCCSPKFEGGSGWGIFYALLGWQNSATYGSVISYNVYWIVVSLGFLWLGWSEKRERKANVAAGEGSEGASSNGLEVEGKGVLGGSTEVAIEGGEKGAFGGDNKA